MFGQETCNNKEVYDPSDFMRLYQLVCHSQHRTPEDLFHRCVMIVFLMKALKKTKYFEGKAASSGEFVQGKVLSVMWIMFTVTQIIANLCPALCSVLFILTTYTN